MPEQLSQKQEEAHLCGPAPTENSGPVSASFPDRDKTPEETTVQGKKVYSDSWFLSLQSPVLKVAAPAAAPIVRHTTSDITSSH